MRVRRIKVPPEVGRPGTLSIDVARRVVDFRPLRSRSSSTITLRELVEIVEYRAAKNALATKERAS